MSTLIIHRDSGFADRARKYRVFCGSKKIGVVRNGEITSFEVSPGKHIIYFKIDWARSNKIEIDFEENKTEVVKVQSNLRGIRLVLAPYYAFFAFWKYLRAEHERA